MAVINLKGGTTKTTSAVFLAHALYERGRRVLLIDADPQGSALSWNEDAPQRFPFSVIGLPTRDLHAQLPDFVTPEIDAIVIDTPPLDQKGGIVKSAMRIATVAVVPIAPTSMEYSRLDQIATDVADSGYSRPGGQAVPMAVLFTRTIPHTNSSVIWRELLTKEGYWCLDVDVRRREIFAQAYGHNIYYANQTAYGDALNELLNGGGGHHE